MHLLNQCIIGTLEAKCMVNQLDTKTYILEYSIWVGMEQKSKKNGQIYEKIKITFLHVKDKCLYLQSRKIG